MKPNILLVASKEGTALIKSLLSDCNWLTVKSKSPIPVHRTVLGKTEIIALGFQLVRARYSNADIHGVIRSLRRQNAKLYSSGAAVQCYKSADTEMVMEDVSR